MKKVMKDILTYMAYFAGVYVVLTLLFLYFIGWHPLQ